MLRRAVLAAVLMLAARPAAAQFQQEEIRNFTSDIVIANNGELSVTETISVVSTGQSIAHGIFRDFPTTYADRYGNRVRVRFDIQTVTRDGHGEPHSTEALDNGVRVKIGAANTTIDPGLHTYTLAYVTNRQIGFFDKFDDLYWNVTGNGWVFPIAHAEATVHLPSPARIVSSAFYTGRQGATGKNGESSQLSDDTVRFDTTAPLGAYEGLTIGVSFSKGAVAPPSDAAKILDFLRDNESVLTALLGAVVTFAFYLLAWSRVGRDPKPGVVIPLFAPPDNLSPEAVRFVRRMAYDRKSFAAALINMAVKGYITIAQQGKIYTLARTGKSEDATNLANGERALAGSLFDSPTDSITLKQTNHSDISAAIRKLKASLERECEPHYFIANTGWFVCGLFLAGVGIAASLVISATQATSVSVLSIVAFVAVGIVTLVFHRVLRAPTLAGAPVRDQIEGFRWFLNTAEKDRLEVLNPPNVTPEIFEKFLPYAIALDCENRWSERFEAETARAAAAGQIASYTYTPMWYFGGAYTNFQSSDFASSVGSSLANAAAAAASTPGSSSGGGGGFSGGGGGGGGGGGW